jgi:hypothetical protein
MREFTKVSKLFWSLDSGRQHRGDVDAQVLAIYLLTCPNATLTGIYYVPFVTIAHETGLGVERAKSAIARLRAAGYADYDDEGEIVWVPSMADYQFGKTLSAGKRRVVVAELGRYADHPFVGKFIDRYGSSYVIEAPTKVTPGE